MALAAGDAVVAGLIAKTHTLVPAPLSRKLLRDAQDPGPGPSSYALRSNCPGRPSAHAGGPNCPCASARKGPLDETRARCGLMMRSSKTVTLLLLSTIAIGMFWGAQYVRVSTAPARPAAISSSPTAPLPPQVGKSVASNEAKRPEVVTAPEVGTRGRAPEEVVSPEPLRRAAVPLASVGRLDDTSERLQAAKGVLQQTLQRMLDEHPDLAQRLISGARMPEERRPEPAGPGGGAGAHRRQRSFPRHNRHCSGCFLSSTKRISGSTLNNAVNGSNEKGH